MLSVVPQIGTPARAAALVAGVPEIVLEKRSKGKWSVKPPRFILDSASQCG